MHSLLLKSLIACALFSVSCASDLVAQSASTLFAFPPNVNNYNQEPIGLVADAAGNLYGVLEAGGSLNCELQGCGQIYELIAPRRPYEPWTMRILYQFTGGADGCWPEGQMAMDSSGALYGVTIGLSCGRNGGIFRLSHKGSGQWTLETISDQSVNSVLALDPDGNVFATTSSQALEFRKPRIAGDTWIEVQIASISGGASGGLQYFDGRLYGTTVSGGDGFGSVFELSPIPGEHGQYEQTEITSFHGGTDGTGPSYVDRLGLYVVNDRTIFGITQPVPPFTAGYLGTVYILQKESDGTWQRSVIHRFSGTDGALPETVTATSDGKHVFGATFDGGTSSQGTVFALSLSASPSASWYFDSFSFTQPDQGFPAGNVLINKECLGVYVTEQFSGSVIDVRGLLPPR